MVEDLWRDGLIHDHMDALHELGWSALATPGIAAVDREPLRYTKVALGRAAGGVCRAGGGGGTAHPGRVLLRLAPDAIGRLGRQLAGGSTLVGGTNGKTTTAGLLAGILRAAGREPVHNRAGANAHWGIATALVEQTGGEGLFEVDEAWLPLMAAELDARLVVLLNLSRDRLDCYGELERVATAWRDALTGRSDGPGLVLNADDPIVAELGHGAQVTWFGIEDESAAAAAVGRNDAPLCRRCGEHYVLERVFIGHSGHYGCAGCGAARPRPDVAAVRVRPDGLSGTDLRLRTPLGEIETRLRLPGLYNVYNAVAAAAAAIRLGVRREPIARGLASAGPVFGRGERVEVPNGEVWIFLAKNPTGTDQVLRTLDEASGGSPVDMWIALNDDYPDGRDVSWIWDANYEEYAGVVRSVTCSGTRAAELGVRLKYAGWPADRIEVDAAIDRSLDRALTRAAGPLFALPTYTAMLELRVLLSRRGHVPDYWR